MRERAPGHRRPARALAAIARAGCAAGSLRAYRARVLAALAEVVAYDAAVFHALSPRVPLATAVVVGLDPARVEASRASWDDLAVELAPLRARADARLVASDDEVFAPGGRARARFERLVARPLGARSLCVVHLAVRGAVRAAVVLLARRPGAFGEAERRALRRLAPAIAVGDALHERLDGAPRASSPARLRCVDQRLTPRQRRVAELVALGHTNVAIAAALGVSAHTVRNHLARAFARLGAANRADLVRLAVLRPEPGPGG